MEALTINTAARYDVLFGRGILDEAGDLAGRAVRGRRVLIVSDGNVAPLYMARARASFERAGFAACEFVFAPGEQSKNIETLSRLLEYAAEQGLTRADLMAALGGGVVGDLTGLAAALYMRGIDFVQLPTTLLAMVDSSVGGKTAVDLSAGKNLCGAFHQPRLVVCDMDTLSTLPAPVYSEGMAEVIKYGAICSPAILDALGAGGDIAPVIRECVRIKGEIVTRDERDTGLRQLLNLGHTFGHAIEKLSGFGMYHGEGVGIGMLMAACAAESHGLCEAGVQDELRALLAAQGLPLTTRFTAAQIAQSAMSDKKKQGATLTLVLPERRGSSRLYPIAAAELAGFIAPCEGVVAGI